MPRVALVLGAAAALAACRIEPINSTGAIRAGVDSDASCPPGQLVRWGRCCPIGSAPNVCPAGLERDPTGARYEPEGCSCDPGFERRGNVCCSTAGGVACTGDGRRRLTQCICPAGYEVRFNQCCPVDAGPECPPGEIGSPCAVHEDCGLPIGANGGLAPFCLRPDTPGALRLPNGYCSVANCANERDCGPQGVCLPFQLSPTGQASLCVRGCDAPPSQVYAACPLTHEEYSCHRTVLPSRRRVAVCLPDCVANPNVCPSGAPCQPDTHACAVACASEADSAACVSLGYARCNVAARRCEY